MDENSTLTLCKAEYSRSGGMVFGTDIAIQITDKEIVYASFFPWEGMKDYSGDETDKIVVEHKPVEPAQWADIEEAVNAIFPLLKIAEERKPPKSKPIPALFQVLDGGDKSDFRLTWRDENGKENTFRYFPINDRRFYTLLDIMCETVHPTGREIVRYGEPMVNGVYVSVGKPTSGRDKDFSFNCTEKAGEKGVRRFYAYYGENKQPISYYAEINEEIWEKIAEKLKELGVEQWKSGKYEDNPIITLYFDDGKSAHFKPDKKSLAELKAFFIGIVRELKNK